MKLFSYFSLKKCESIKYQRYSFWDAFVHLQNSQYILLLLDFSVNVECFGRCLSAVTVYIGIWNKDLDYICKNTANIEHL